MELAFAVLALVIIVAIAANLRSVCRGAGPDSVALRVNAAAFALVLLLGVVIATDAISRARVWPALIALAPLLAATLALLAYAFRGPSQSR
ncbi:MAG: hypothetical protein HYX57_08995 [Chloroflexi bacterium]|nr:hypothetical protein [Chloroflexota bacterium]